MPGAPFPPGLDLTLEAKRPARLQPATERHVLDAPLPEPVIDGRGPAASIVVLTHDNLAFTRMCLESVLASTDSPAFELIVVDNASSDGTPGYLRDLAARDSRVRLQLMRGNLGFAAAVNSGLRDARGDFFVVLNNDTIVPPGWLSGLLWHLADPVVGLAGPVTNQAPGAARVADAHATYGEFLTAADARGRTTGARDVDSLTFFCVALPRQVYTSVGPLDERFELGMFEDDDYCLRVRNAGLSVRLAEDVLVHHFGEASFGRLVADGTWKSVFEANRARFEAKWARPWTGHVAPDEPGYVELVGRVRDVVERLPDGSRVLVATRGDERLRDFPGRVAGHFPQLADGTYAGSYPADDAAAVQQLRDLAAGGWTHLAMPNPARWWLVHYPSMKRHLESRGVVIDDPETAIVFRV